MFSPIIFKCWTNKQYLSEGSIAFTFETTLWPCSTIVKGILAKTNLVLLFTIWAWEDERLQGGAWYSGQSRPARNKWMSMSMISVVSCLPCGFSFSGCFPCLCYFCIHKITLSYMWLCTCVTEKKKSKTRNMLRLKSLLCSMFYACSFYGKLKRSFKSCYLSQWNLQSRLKHEKWRLNAQKRAHTHID